MRQPEYMKQIFNEEQINKAVFIIESPLSKLSELYHSEVENLAILWCYYSGKIEGNGYTYVETETLLKNGITPSKKYEDAEMLINLHNTFTEELKHIKGENSRRIDKSTLFRVYQSISSDLVPDEKSGYLRNRTVCVSGIEYTPTKELHKIREKLDEILYQQEQYTNPLERAVYLHCNIAQLQPFTSENKHAPRIIETFVLMHADIIPVYSLRDADVLNYKKRLISFCKTGAYSLYADYFLNRQIERIKEIEE